MEQLIKSLPAVVQAGAASPEVMQCACIAAWNHVVGETLQRNAVAIEVRDRTLVVAIPDQMWQKQLKTMLGQLISRVNSALGRHLVNSIELRVAPEIVAGSTASHKPGRTEVQDVPMELQLAASTIQDVQLRKSFLAAAVSCLRRKENLR